MKFRPTCIEAFSGPGGLGLGLHQAGFEVLAAFDADQFAVETYRRNLSPRCFLSRAEDLTGRTLLELVKLHRGELDLLAGGPPCQGFSKQKRGAHNGDDRNSLIMEFARLTQEILPKFFMFENVAIFAQKRGASLLAELSDLLIPCGYRLFPHFYNSADFGLPQTRERFILVGQRNDLPNFKLPKPTCSKWKTVGDCIGDLPEPPTDYSDHAQYRNHQRARVTAINIRRFSFVPQGGGWENIPKKLRLKCHQRVDRTSGGWPDVYGRLRWDGQAPTITGGFDSFTRGRYGHPIHNRPLTPREAARLQGFPDSYVFYGSRAHIRSQIGNAVPPPLAKVIGKSIMRALQSQTIPPKTHNSRRSLHDAIPQLIT
jgi:DNA (cytosine-5)-methyltransferase 1